MEILYGDEALLAFYWLVALRPWSFVVSSGSPPKEYLAARRTRVQGLERGSGDDAHRREHMALLS